MNYIPDEKVIRIVCEKPHWKYAAISTAKDIGLIFCMALGFVICIASLSALHAR